MTPPTVLDSETLGAGEAPCDQDDIFGPSRSYPPRSDRPRPSMISAKLKAKEERKKVIQICTEKLEKIKDPDRNLRRSVCINNTYSKLQDEVRREKQLKNAPSPVSPKPPSSEQKQRLLDKALESIDLELNAIGANMPSLEPELLPELPTPLSLSINMDAAYSSRVSSNDFSMVSDKLDYEFRKLDNDNRCRSKKRSYSEIEDCDVHEVLSQFYLPATPRLISAIEDDSILDAVPSSCDRITNQAKYTSRTEVAETPPDELGRMKPDFEAGFEEMLGLDLNQNKSYFQSINSSSQEPSQKKIKFEATSPKRDNRIPQRKQSKSEFEIILDALRLDDGKDLCEREDLVYFCGKSDKESMTGRYNTMDSCGQAAYMRTNDQQTTPFLGLPAELET